MAIREVSKDEFHRIYTKLGKGEGGWDVAYWDKLFANDPHPNMKYPVEDPPSRAHTNMNLVTDFSAREYRLFFLTDEGQHSFLEWPETSE